MRPALPAGDHPVDPVSCWASPSSPFDSDAAFETGECISIVVVDAPEVDRPEQWLTAYPKPRRPDRLMDRVVSPDSGRLRTGGIMDARKQILLSRHEMTRQRQMPFLVDEHLG